MSELLNYSVNKINSKLIHTGTKQVVIESLNQFVKNADSLFIHSLFNIHLFNISVQGKWYDLTASHWEDFLLALLVSIGRKWENLSVVSASHYLTQLLESAICSFAFMDKKKPSRYEQDNQFIRLIFGPSQRNPLDFQLTRCSHWGH